MRDVRDLVDLAYFCASYKQFHRAASRFYTAGFAQRPEFAEDLQVPHRYNAACYAALAAAGQGEDAAKLDKDERAQLRGQALGWLRDDLKALNNLLEKNKNNRSFVLDRLRHRLQDPDFTSVREEKSQRPHRGGTQGVATHLG